MVLLGSGEVRHGTKILGSVLDPLLHEVPADVGIMRIRNNDKIKKIIVSTAGGPNAKLAFEWGSWLAKQNKGELTLLYIMRDETGKENALRWLEETKKDVDYEKERVQDKIVVGRDIYNTILKESKGYDLILIGASRKGLWNRIRFGDIPERLTRMSSPSVLVASKYEGKILSWLRRFIVGQ